VVYSSQLIDSMTNKEQQQHFESLSDILKHPRVAFGGEEAVIGMSGV